MTVKQAQRLIEEKFVQAKKMPSIRDPLAWALYQVWKMADAEGPRSSSIEKEDATHD